MSSNAVARSLFSALVLVAGSVIAPAATLTWDANGTTAGVTDGAGAWLTANRWWDGSSTITWTSGNDAIFGVGGTGGAVTLSATTSVASLTFNTFLGTYTLGTLGTTLTVDAGGLTMNSGSGTVSIISPVALGAAQSWTNNKATTLTVSGIVGNGGNTLTVSGSGPSTLSGVISGAGGLTKSGEGLLTLSAANTYTGATTVSGGVLRLSGATALPGGINATGGVSALTLNGGVLELGNANFLRNLGSGADQFQITGGTSGFSAFGAARTVTVNDNAATTVTWGSAEFNPGTFVLNGSTATGAITFSNPIDLNGATRTVAVNANTATLSGVLSGAGTGLTKIGAGTLTLSAANTYSGATTISAGTLTLGDASALGAESGNLAVSGGVLNLGSFNVTRTGTVSFTGGTVQSGTITNNTAVAYDGQSGTVADTATLAGSAGLTKTTSGTLTLGNNRTYTGATIVNDGKLILRNATGDLTNYSSLLTINNGGTLELTTQFNGNANITGDVTVNAGGLLSLQRAGGSGRSQILSNLILNGGTVEGPQPLFKNTGTIQAKGGVTSTISAAIANTGNNTIYNMYVDTSSTLLVSGQVQTGGANIQLKKYDEGTLILSNANNTYTGLTTVLAGVLNIRANAALGTTATGTTVTSGAALEVQGGITVGAEALTLNGSGISSGGALRNISDTNTYGGLITIGSATRINSDAGTLTLDVASGNAITGAAHLVTFGGAGNITVADAIATSAVIKDGAGTLTLSASNAYQGGTTINFGTLRAEHANAFGAGAIVLASNASLDLNNLAVANAITNNGGTISGLAGYAGTQNVLGLTALTGTVGGTVNVGNGGTLKGTNTTFTGAVAIADQAIHSPGNSPGVQTFENGISYDAGSTLVWELVANTTSNPGTAFDLVNVTGGNLAIADGALLQLEFQNTGLVSSAVDWSNTFWDVAQSWTIIDFSGGGNSSGNFTLLGSGTSWFDSTGASLATARNGDASFQVSNVNGDVVLSYVIVVPEPGTLVLAGVGIAVAGALYVRRRRG